MTGGIASVDTLNTTSAFALSGSGLAVDITGGGGSAADATVDTDGSGDVTAVTITTPGTGYAVGNIITISETTGSGVATARVASVA